MSVKIQIKRANASAWTAANPTLAAGEWGMELDTKKLKLGTGALWNSTDYYSETLTLNSVGDITITSLQNGDFLRYSSSASAWINDPVNLSTDTVGDYVQGLVAGTGVTLSNNTGEGATPTIAIGQAVGTSSSVQFASVTAPLTGNASTATALETARNISLTGDVSGSVSFNGTSDVSISATVQPNSVALGTDTTGNYMSELTQGTGVTITHTPGEGSNATIAIGQAVATSSSVTFAQVSAPVTGNLTGNASTATTLETGRTISLSGDVSGSVSFDGSADATISATIQPNSVALGTDTTGNYVNDVAAGTGVTVTHTPAEGSSPTIAIGQDVATSASVTFARLETTGNVVIGGNLTVNGDTTTLNTETLSVEDNTIVLNSNAAGSPTLNAGIEVERGDSANVSVRWNESTDSWELTEDGSTYKNIAVGQDVETSASVTFVAVTAELVGNSSTSSALKTPRTIALSGDVSGSVSFDGSANVDITATVQPNSVALGTDTTGNYVNDVTAGTGVTVTHTPGEGSSASVAIGQDVATSASVEFAALEVTGQTTVGGHILPDATETYDLGSASARFRDIYLSGTSINLGGAEITSDGTSISFPGGLTGDVGGNADTASTLETARTISLGGDLSGSVSFDGSADVTITATIEPDSVALGVDTTGNFMSDVVGSTGVTVSHTPGESSSASISIGQDVATTASVTFVHVAADVTGNLTGDVTGNADTASELETARTISLAGDLSGSASFDGSTNVTITATVQPDSVALGTDTTGNFMSDVVAGTGVTVTHTPGESSSASIAIGQDVATSASVTFAKVTISGDLTVSGTTTTLNTEELLVEDNIVTLNSNVVGAPSANAGIEIERGDSANVQLRWNETTDSWETTDDGSTYKNIAVGQDVETSSSVTFAAVTAPLIGNASTATTLQTSRTINLGGDLSGSVSFDGSENVTITATVEPDSVALGTDTTGNYLVDVVADGSGITVSHTPGEGSSASLSLAQDINTTASVTFAHVSADVTGDLTGNADTASTLTTSRAISLAGDLSGSVSFNGSSDVTITANVEPNSVALGTDTTGNFVNDVVAGTGVTVSHTPGEGSSASIAIGQDVATTASVTFAAVTAPVIGNASTATTLETSRAISLAGDLSGSVSFNGSQDVTITATVQPDSVALGADTTGNFVADVVAGHAITVMHTPGEASSASVALNALLDDLNDVSASAAEKYQTLVYDGAEWESEYPTVVSLAGNAEATTLTVGTAVYLFGGTGNHASVKRADNSSDVTSSKTVGLVGEAITAGDTGPIITRGYLKGVDLSVGYTNGDVLWLGKNGELTKTKPQAPDHLVFVGVVVSATNNGIIYVATQNGYEIEELHDVRVTSVQDGDFLRYNSASSIWVNEPINLGTDTVGNYVSDVTAGTGVTVAHTPGEGSSPSIAIGQDVATSASVTFAKVDTTGDLTVGGNLTVNGTTTTLNTETLAVEDNIVILNSNATGSPALNAGIEVERGDSANVVLRWNESTDNWETTNDGSAYSVIATNGNIALGTDTTGNYVNDVTAGTGVTITHTPGEGSSPTVAIGQSVATSASVTFAHVAADVTGNVTGNVTGSSGSTTGNAATATALQNARTISLSGDVSGSVSFDGTSNVSITATVQPDSVTLGTDTTGNFMSDVVGGTGITISHTPGESSSASIAIGQDVATSASVTFAAVTAPVVGNVTGNVTGDVTGNADTATALETARTISLTGDVSGSVSFDGTGDVSITATVQPDSVALGTDTTGNFVNDLTAGTGVTVTHTPGEGSSPTVAIGQSVATSASVTFAKVDTTGDVVVGGNLTVNGTTTTLNTETLAIEDNIIVLNNGVTGSPTINAGIEVERGDSANVVLRWNETSDKWEATNDGTNYGNIVTTADSGTVTSTMIVDGTIVNADINASAAISLSKLTSGTSAQVIIANASGVPTYTTLSGDLTISDTGVAAIAANSVALGTDTTGNYVNDVVAGTGITVSHTPSEGSSASIALNASLDDLNNVSASAPSNGQFLKYVSASSSWISADIPSINTLDDVGDVTITSASAGQFLQWNGSAWINAYPEANAYVSDTPPASPSEGDLWFDSSTLDIFVRYDSAWLQINTENPVEELSDLVDVSAESAEPNQFLKYDGTEWVAASPILPITISTQAANYSITLSDVNKLIEMSIGTANTVTVPTNQSHAIPVGSRIEIVQYGSGKTQVIGDTGVTVRSYIGNYISGQYGCVILTKRATNEWILCGDLSAS